MGWDTFWDNFSQTHLVTLTIVYTCPKRLWCSGSVSAPGSEDRGFASTPVRSGVDVMITIFSDFRTFSAKKLPFFLKPML
jgi:hypothetical protein